MSCEVTKLCCHPWGFSFAKDKSMINANCCGCNGIREFALVDNIACENVGNIISAADLTNIKDKFVVIDTGSNSAMHEEILNILRCYVEDENIYTVFETK